jgi:hypothetical protein
VGAPNKVTSDLKKALEDSAEIVGLPKWVPKLDENGKERATGSSCQAVR